MTAITSRQVEATARKGEQLTLGDLRAFIGTLDAAGAADSTPIYGRSSARAKIMQLRARAVRLGDSDPEWSVRPSV